MGHQSISSQLDGLDEFVNILKAFCQTQRNTYINNLCDSVSGSVLSIYFLFSIVAWLGTF